MEIQVAERVMADMFDDESHLEKRVEVAWRSKLRMLSNDSNRQNVDLEEEEHLEWHGCDLPVVQVFRRTSRAVCTELAAYKRSRPMRGMSDHGGTSCRTSDGRHV